MKHIWTVLCQKSVIDNETNLISLIDCLEELNLTMDMDKEPGNTSEKIVIPLNFQVASFWLIEDKNLKKLEIKIELNDPENNKINEINNVFELKEDYLRYRTRINVQGMPITKSGRYLFKIYQIEQGGISKCVSEVPLDVKIDYKLPNLRNPKK
jgi:hypothetical protein